MPVSKNLTRRQAVLASAVGLWSSHTLAQSSDWPNRPVKLVVGYAAGNPGDALGRLVAARLSEALGQSVVVENKPGQGGSLGLAQAAKAKPDGYTLTLAATAALVVNPHLYSTLGYRPQTDFTPVVMLGEAPMFLVCNAAAPFKTFAEFIAYAKANPDKLRHSLSGNDTLTHLGMELLQQRTETHMQHVPYQGSVAAMLSIASGVTEVGMDGLVAVQPHLQSKRVRLLATTAAQRFAQFPETPTVAESGLPGFEMSTWIALLGPRGMPAPIVARIETEVQRMFKDPALDQQARSIGVFPRNDSSAQLTSLIQREDATWARVVRTANVKAD